MPRSIRAARRRGQIVRHPVRLPGSEEPRVGRTCTISSSSGRFSPAAPPARPSGRRRDRPGPSPNRRVHLRMQYCAFVTFSEGGPEALVSPAPTWRRSPSPVVAPEGAAARAQTRRLERVQFGALAPGSPDSSMNRMSADTRRPRSSGCDRCCRRSIRLDGARLLHVRGRARVGSRSPAPSTMNCRSGWPSSAAGKFLQLRAVAFGPCRARRGRPHGPSSRHDS